MKFQVNQDIAGFDVTADCEVVFGKTLKITMLTPYYGIECSYELTEIEQGLIRIVNEQGQPSAPFSRREKAKKRAVDELAKILNQVEIVRSRQNQYIGALAIYDETNNKLMIQYKVSLNSRRRGCLSLQSFLWKMSIEGYKLAVFENIPEAISEENWSNYFVSPNLLRQILQIVQDESTE